MADLTIHYCVKRNHTSVDSLEIDFISCACIFKPAILISSQSSQFKEWNGSTCYTNFYSNKPSSESHSRPNSIILAKMHKGYTEQIP